MRILFLAIFVALSCSAYGAGVIDSATEKEIKTKIGILAVTKDEKTFTSTLRLNRKKILEHEGYDISMSESIDVSGKELVLIYVASGGIACPGDLAVFEAKTPYRLSKNFGNCNEEFQAKVKGDSLEVSMRRYIPHPDLMSKSEYRKESKKVDLYIWRDGNVVERKGK